MTSLSEKSALELYARQVAEVACDWAAQQTGGRSPRWAELGWMAQDALENAALTQIALSTAIRKIPVPEKVT